MALPQSNEVQPDSVERPTVGRFSNLTAPTVFQTSSQAAALLLVAATLYRAILSANGSSVLQAFPSPAVLGMLVVICLTSVLLPRATVATALLLFACYLLVYQVPVLMPQSIVFLLLIGGGGYCAADRLQHTIFAQLGDGSAAYRWLIAGICSLAALCSISFLTLLFHYHQADVLLGLAAAWALGSVAISFAGRRDIAAQSIGAVPDKQRLASPVAEMFIAASLIVILLFCLVQLHPHANVGDANKSYLAFAKYYSWSNSLVLREPAWELDQNHAFPHLQEILLAAGYTLDGKWGAKLFAIFIFVLKVQAIFWVACRVFRFSATTAWGVLTAYLLTPIVMDLNMGVRPENLLTVLSLYAFWLFEEAVRLRGPATEAPVADKRALDALLLAGAMVCFAASTKYTGIHYGLACALVYAGTFLWALPRLHTSSRLAQFVSGVSVLVLAFWFARNLLVFDRWVSSSPYGKYHLTIVFPGLRSVEDLWNFLTKGLVALRSGHYTEFPDYGYGVWGFVLLPVLFWGWSLKGVPRRASIISSIVIALLLTSTSQIRYYAHVVPLLYCTMAAVLLSLPGWQWLSGLLQRRRAVAGTVVLLFLLTQMVVAAAVSKQAPSRVYNIVSERLMPDRETFAREQEPWHTFNERLDRHDMVMGGRLDSYFDVDAKMYYTNGALFGKFYDVVQSQNVTHLIQHPLLRNLPDNFFFNDQAFLGSIAEQIASAPLEGQPGMNAYLYRLDRAALERIKQFIGAQGWNADDLLLVSEARAKQRPLELTLGDRLKVPGIAEPLYRVQGYWHRLGQHYRQLPAQSGDPIVYHPRSWFFKRASKEATQSANLQAEVVSEPAAVRGPGGGLLWQADSDNGPIELIYRFQLPKQSKGNVSQVKLYLKGRAVYPGDKLEVRLQTDIEEHIAELADFDERRNWLLASEFSLVQTEGLTVSLKLSPAPEKGYLELLEFAVILGIAPTTEKPNKTTE